MQFKTITIVRPYMANETEVHMQGNLLDLDLHEALDKVRKETGTHDWTPLDRFLDEHRMKPSSWRNRDGSFHVTLDTSYKHRQHDHSLYLAHADGATPAAAKRTLANTISGKFLAHGGNFAYPNYIEVPDLTEVPHWDNSRQMLTVLESMLDHADPNTLQQMADAINARAHQNQPATA